MAQVTIYKDSSITVNVIDGLPPVDQSAEVAALTAQVATLTTELATANAATAAAQLKIDAAKAALA